MDRRVQILRFWIATLAVVVIAIYAPAWSLIFLATNCFGWWGGSGCCPTCGGATKACSAAHPTTASVTVSGYVSILCASGTGPDNCATKLNVTHSLPFTLDNASGCTFKNTNTLLSCGGTGNFNTPSSLISPGATHTSVLFQMLCVDPVNGSTSVQWNTGTSLAASPLDCSGFGTLNLTTLVADGCVHVCDASPVSVSVVFS